MKINFTFADGTELLLSGDEQRVKETANRVLSSPIGQNTDEETEVMPARAQRYDDGYCDGYEAAKIGDSHARELLLLYREEAADPEFPEPGRNYAQGFADGFGDYARWQSHYGGEKPAADGEDGSVPEPRETIREPEPEDWITLEKLLGSESPVE